MPCPFSHSAFQPEKKTYLLPSGDCVITDPHVQRPRHQCENTGEVGARSNSKQRCNTDKIPRWTRSTSGQSTSCETRSAGTGHQV